MNGSQKNELTKEHLINNVQNCSLYLDEGADSLSAGNCNLWVNGCSILTDSSCYPMLFVSGCVNNG